MVDIKLDHEEKSLDAVLTVNIKLKDFEEEAIKNLKTQRQKINLPGFRQGKVPLGIAKKYLWENIVKEEIEKNLEKSIDSYFEKIDFEIIKPVLPIITDKKIDLSSDEEFEFKYDVGLVDEFELDHDKLFKKLNKYEIDIKPEDVGKEVEIIRETYGEHKHPDAVEDNENIVVYLDFAELNPEKEKLEEGIQKKISRKLKDLPETLRKNILGIKKEESVNIEIENTFKDRKEFGDLIEIEKLEAEDANNDFEVKVLSIHEHNKAAMDEALYEKATQGKVKTKEEFLQEVENILKDSYKRNSEQLLNDDIYHALIDNVDFNLPVKFLDRLFEEEYREKKKEMSPEDLNQERKNYDSKIKWAQIINRYIKKYGVTVEEKEIAQEAYSYVANMYMQYGMYQTPEQMEEIMKEFLQKRENIMFIKERVEVSKVFENIQNEFDFKPKTITIDEFKKINEEKHKQNHE